MEAYINYAKIAWKNKKIKRQYLLSDLTVQTLEISDTEKFLNSDMGLFVTDSGKEFEYINQMSEMAKMMIQNGASVETVSYILKARAQGTSPEEIHKMITKMQLDSEARQQQASQAEQENQKQIAQMQIEAREDEQEHEIQITQMKIEGELAKSEIDATRFKQAQDVNNNNERDVVEVAKLKIASDKQTTDLEIKNKELDIKKKELELKSHEIAVNADTADRKMKMDAEVKKYIARQKPKTSSK